jgi:tetratricopeptide (TPR) repeat protein
MAEGILGGLLGGDAEDGAGIVASAEAAAGADAFAIAMAIEQARHDPRVAAATVVFLEKQARLLEVQTAQLDAERGIRLHHLHDQSYDSKLRGYGTKIRLGMQVFGALVATVLGLGLIVMLHDAFASHAVVVEAFETPPALGPHGITGKLVASGILDRLQALAKATRSKEKARTAYSAWSSDIKIDVPETGVSIGEINRLLHARFGSDLHIGGELVQSEGGGLALTIRGDGVPARRFAGGAGDLEKLTAAAADYAYGSSQPYVFAAYLTGQGRDADALAFIPGAFADADSDVLRSKLANTWGNAYADLNQAARAVEKYRLAISLDPGNWVPRMNLPAAISIADGEEAGWRASADFLRAAADARGGGPEKRYYQAAAQFMWDLPLLLTADLADSVYNAGAGTITLPDGPIIADAYGMLHDPDQAARYMAASDPADPNARAEALLLQVYAALDRGDANAAVAPMEAFWTDWQGSPLLQSTDQDYGCLLVLVYGLAGRVADAHAVFAKAGRWNRCFAFYGFALAKAGDGAGAGRVWAEGARIAPDLPFVYLYRGLNEASGGAGVAAEGDFAAAHRAAPHLAEPLKAWGDFLAAQGRWREALGRYDEALRYAPAWEGLRRAKGVAAGKI